MGAADGDLSRDAALARLEAVLLMAGGSLSSRRLAELAGLADGTQARTLVRRLNEIYDGRGVCESHGPGDQEAAGERAAFRVEEVAGGFQLMTRPCFSPWLRRLHASPVQVRLSTSALETLAVIAYRQPVLRAELEAIRGVQCGEMLRQLGERDLVRIAGRSPELGRPFLYGTSKKFLQVFGLRSLDELPRASLRPGAVAVRSEPIQPEPGPSEPMLLQVSHDPTDTKEESAVKIALLSTAHDVQDELLAFPAALPLTDRPGVDPRADEDLEEDDDEEELEDDDDDLEEEEDEEEDDDLEEEEWEEVDDDEEDEEDWEDDDDEDWDEEEDEDWEEEEEEEKETEG